MPAETTISVKRVTHERLAIWCGKLRTFDEAINDLLDMAEKKREGDVQTL